MIDALILMDIVYDKRYFYIAGEWEISLAVRQEKTYNMVRNRRKRGMRNEAHSKSGTCMLL